MQYGEAGDGVVEYGSHGKTTCLSARTEYTSYLGRAGADLREKSYGFYAFFRGFPRFYAQIRAVFTRFYAFLRVGAFF